MSEFEDPSDDIARLELALERIATRARRDPGAAAMAESRATSVPLDVMASRIDAMIARLRAALSSTAG
jgi:hypothetical protein